MNKENMLIPSKILKKVSDIELFSSSMKKLTLSEKLENNEKEFILTVALFFLQEYSKDKRRRQYREFAYYIILKYSTLHNDFKPLYDISVVL
jgi:putative DNA helicase